MRAILGTLALRQPEEPRAFQAQPEVYAPQYGGYCAYALSQGATAPGDPNVWQIVDGKLYLNVNEAVGKIWANDNPGYITKADANWPKLLAASECTSA